MTAAAENVQSILKKIRFWKLTGFIALLALSACSHSSNIDDDGAGKSAYLPPVVTKLGFNNQHKINWDKTISCTPVTQTINLNNIPAQTYSDTNSFKPFAHPTDTLSFSDYDKLPYTKLKLSQKPVPLVFHTTVLKSPKFIKTGPMQQYGNTNTGLYALNEMNGLEGSSLMAMYTDHNGFLWLSTEKGIFRYDGETLIKYISNPLPIVYTITEDRAGRIWMGSLGSGVAVFNPKTNEYSLIDKKSLKADSVWRMLTDKRGRIWFARPRGITIVDPEQNTQLSIDKLQGIKIFGNTDMALDDEQRLWVGGSTMNIVDLDKQKIINLNVPGLPEKTGADNKYYHALYHSSGDRIWIGSTIAGSLAAFDVRRHKVYVINNDIPPQQNSSAELTEDADGHVVFTDIRVAYILDTGMRAFKKISIIPGTSQVYIYATSADKNGNTLFGSTNGLIEYKHNNLLSEHIGSQPVTTVLEDTGNIIYSGTLKGLDMINRAKRSVRKLTRQGGVLSSDSVETLLTGPHGELYILSLGGLQILDSARQHITTIKSTRWQAMAFDKSGRMWIGSEDGLNLYDPVKKTLAHLDNSNNIKTVDILSADEKGDIWVLDDRARVFVISPEAGTIKTLNGTDQQVRPIQGAMAFLCVGNDKWIGTPKGIIIVNEKQKTVTHLTPQQGLMDEEVLSLLKWGDKIYAGTNKGISVIQPGTNGNKWNIISFGHNYDIKKANVGFFLTDNITRDGQYIWGDNGLSFLNLNAHLKREEPAVFITGFSLMDEPLYFTASGNNSKDPVQAYNKRGKVLGAYNLPADLDLPHDANNLRFTFTNISSFKNDTVWYRYMLSGIDKAWRPKTTETATGNYFSLPPGDYTFKVEAVANDGSWSKPAIFNFTISPPWWQTWWARLIFLVMLIVLIWLIVHLRSQSLLRSKKVLEQKVAIRTQEVLEQKEELAAQRDSLEQALGELKQTQSQLIQSEKMASLGELTAGIAHEIQNPLNFVNNFAEVNVELIDEMLEEMTNGSMDEVRSIADDIKENEKKISMHGKRADAIVKSMLQHSRAGSGVKEPTDINKLADEYLRLSYHGLRAKDKTFNAEMITHFAANLPPVNILPQEVGRVLLNLFNNAFYAVKQRQQTAGKDYKPILEVTTTAKNNTIEITVKDNGTGIPDAVKDKILQPFFTTKPTGEGTGLGLSLSYDIVVKGHNGTLAINSKEGEFTEFIITLPLK